MTVTVFRKKEKKRCKKMEDGDRREGRRTVAKHLIHSSTEEKRKGLTGLRDRIQGQSGEEEKEDEGWGVLQKCLEGLEPFSECSAGSH